MVAGAAAPGPSGHASVDCRTAILPVDRLGHDRARPRRNRLECRRSDQLQPLRGAGSVLQGRPPGADRQDVAGTGRACNPGAVPHLERGVFTAQVPTRRPQQPAALADGRREQPLSRLIAVSDHVARDPGDASAGERDLADVLAVLATLQGHRPGRGVPDIDLAPACVRDTSSVHRQRGDGFRADPRAESTERAISDAWRAHERGGVRPGTRRRSSAFRGSSARTVSARYEASPGRGSPCRSGRARSRMGPARSGS